MNKCILLLTIMVVIWAVLAQYGECRRGQWASRGGRKGPKEGRKGGIRGSTKGGLTERLRALRGGRRGSREETGGSKGRFTGLTEQRKGSARGLKKSHSPSRWILSKGGNNPFPQVKRRPASPWHGEIHSSEMNKAMGKRMEHVGSKIKSSPLGRNIQSSAKGQKERRRSWPGRSYSGERWGPSRGRKSHSSEVGSSPGKKRGPPRGGRRGNRRGSSGEHGDSRKEHGKVSREDQDKRSGQKDKE